jgi:acrylyl-CoA reductase (NADPH)
VISKLSPQIATTQRRCFLASHTRGWWIFGDGSGQLTSSLRDDIAHSELGEGNLEMTVAYSALNYKDALALEGSAGVARTTPLVPGIDATGEVRCSNDSRFAPGDQVVLTGWGYGETRHGGLASTLIAQADHVLLLPEGLTTAQGATLGTAGFTAALSLQALKRAGVTPETSTLPIAVTGAAGGVGSFTVFLLAQAGFQVTAITGRTDEADYLLALGATEVVSRQEVLVDQGKPLLPERYSGVIDQVGGPLLATLLASTQSGGAVIACGLAGGSDLPTTVMPFILRGVSLVGVNSVTQPRHVREALWAVWAERAPQFPWDLVSQTIPLAEVGEYAPRVLAGLTRGRVVVDVGV